MSGDGKTGGLRLTIGEGGDLLKSAAFQIEDQEVAPRGSLFAHEGWVCNVHRSIANWVA